MVLQLGKSNKEGIVVLWVAADAPHDKRVVCFGFACHHGVQERIRARRTSVSYLNCTWHLPSLLTRSDSGSRFAILIAFHKRITRCTCSVTRDHSDAPTVSHKDDSQFDVDPLEVKCNAI